MMASFIKELGQMEFFMEKEDSLEMKYLFMKVSSETGIVMEKVLKLLKHLILILGSFSKEGKKVLEYYRK